MERLLRRSCQEVLSRIRSDIVDALAEEGLILDPISLAVQSVGVPHVPHLHGKRKAHVPHSTVHASTFSLGPSISSKIPSYFGTMMTADVAEDALCNVFNSNTSSTNSSARVFHKAEQIRLLLQDEISELLADIILPVCTFNCTS